MDEVRGFDDTIAWYEANAQQYADNIETVPSIPLIDAFVETVGAGKKVLDAGCAGGRDSKLLKERGLDVVGLDISNSLLDIARKRYSDIEFIQGDFRKLPLEDSTFSGVWAHASLVHLETSKEVSEVLNEFNRILKKGGILHIFLKQQQGAEKTSVVSDKLSGHDRFFQWFIKDEVNRLLEDANFSIIIIRDDYPDPAGREEVKWIYSLATKA